MNQGVYPLAATMINQLNRVDVLSNNLANVNTNAFKQDNLSEGSFNHYLYKAQKENKKITKLNTITNTIPKIDNHFVDQSIGTIVSTNNNLDFAIKDKNLFFKIKNPKTGEIVLTRDGAFKVLNKHLVTKNGWDVLDVNNMPIVVEEDFASLIALVRTNYNNLQKQGNNNYRIKSQQKIYLLNNNKDYILQSALEKSNVNSIKTMVGLIDSHRRLEQAQKALIGINEINQKVIEKIGNNR
jgi:flagellar basal-body rod protein FlgG